MPADTLPSEVEIAIVGGGFSGVGMAMRLHRVGIEDYVVLDRGEDVGGTWRDNTYPGAACDVPSHLYSFSFALNPDWSRAYSPQPEIWQYLRDCRDRAGVADHFHYGHDVLDAAFDEGIERWRIRTSGGSLTARIVLWATGPLSEPKVPEFPGLSAFGGKVFHSAAWDHDYPLEGKRVAVIGTGASAIQFVPQIQPRVAELHLYQRTPPWILPRRDHAIPARRRHLYRRLPLAQRLVRASVYLRFEFLTGPAILGRSERRQTLLRKIARAHLSQQVPDPELKELLKQDYQIGCKRILVSDDYYPSLTRDNVEVIPAAVRELSRDGVIDEHGEERRVDAVILGTGFEAAEPSFAARIRGLGGTPLSERWREGMEAYLGSTVDGFPNLFMIIGPNCTLGHNSMVYMIESHLNYAASAIRFLRRPGVGTVEVRRARLDRFNEELRKTMATTTWMTGGCTSWYLDHRGHNTTLWPSNTYRFRQLTRRFRPGDYTVRGPGRLAQPA
jgi:cation diffusion facilitator CzcD-associated flavoprotein CzcO